MQNMTQQYLLITALVAGMWPLSAQADEDQSTEAEPLLPRRNLIKPANTEVDETIHRTDVITVKFREPLLVRLREGSLTDFGTGALLGAEEVLAGAAQGRWERVHSVAEGKLDQWRLTAEANLGKAVADLNLYFNLYLPAGADPGASIDAFNDLDCVELALPVPLVAPPDDCCEGPCPGPPVPDFEPCQGYLDPATDGIDAECMWMVPGGTGAGVKIADVEWSYNPDHLDLSVTMLGPAPENWELHQNHGTAVLGEIGSISNGWGTTGIASDSTVYFVTAFPDTEDPYCDKNTCEVGFNAAMMRAMDLGELGDGDVLLIEVQLVGPNGPGAYVPLEWSLPAYDVIVTVVGNGVTLVEPAGNGTQDLDDPIFCPAPEGCPGFGYHCPFCPEQDSGAIIVGAGASPGSSSPDRSRLAFSGYGTTVDLQGWGNNVVTTGYGGLYNLEGPDLYYTSSFGGTSSASPIVAGACVLLQSAYKQATGLVLTPQQVRDYLRNTGSPQQPSDPPFCEPSPECENIGPRPNLAAAISAAVPSLDGNCNDVPDACECPADLNGDGVVEAADLGILLGSWGEPGCGGELPCPADLNCDGAVEAADLAILLGSWGPCGGLGAGGDSAPMPPPDGSEGPGGGGMTLDQALEVMGFADVDEFNAWTASVPTDEAHAATQQLLELLTQ